MPCRSIIQIGRAPECDFVLRADTVSSRHAVLVVGEVNRHLLIDQESANGTRVAGVGGGETKRS